MTVVVIAVLEVVPPDVTPGNCIWPADAETASANVRIATLHLLSRVFILGASWEEMQKFCMAK
jgi:hypothetical protein